MVWIVRLSRGRCANHSILLWTLKFQNNDNKCLSRLSGRRPSDPIQRTARTIYPDRARGPDSRPVSLYPAVLLPYSCLVLRHNCARRRGGYPVGMHRVQPEIWYPWLPKIEGPTAAAPVHPLPKPPIFHLLKIEIMFEQDFPMPIGEVSDDGLIASKTGSVTAALEIIHTGCHQPTETYESLNRTMVKAISLFPAGTIFLQQDRFWRQCWKPPADAESRSFLARASDAHFTGR